MSSVQLGTEDVCISIGRAALLNLLGTPTTDNLAEPLLLSATLQRSRRGHQLRLIIPADHQHTDDRPPDPKLVALMAETQAARALLLASPDRTINRIAADAGRCRTRLAKLFQLSQLAPDIVQAIVAGRQPGELTCKVLLEASVPANWREQRAALGFS